MYLFCTDESPEAAGPAFQKSSVELSTLGKIEEEPEKMEVNDGEKQAYDPVAWLSVGGGDKKQQQKQSVRYSVEQTCPVLFSSVLSFSTVSLSSGKESETVFVSNLAFSTTDDQLREVFSKVCNLLLFVYTCTPSPSLPLSLSLLSLSLSLSLLSLSLSLSLSLCLSSVVSWLIFA